MYEKIADRAWRFLFRRSYRRQRVRDMGQGSDMGDGDGKPDVAGNGKGSRGFQIENNAATRGLGRMLFKYSDPLDYVDVDGIRRRIPKGFACDKRSSPRWLWWLIPPSDGKTDHAWGIHDFERRCYRLMGVTLADVDGPRFEAAMKAVGINKRGRRWHQAFVRMQGLLTRPRGIGLHREEKYNLPVYCQERAEWMPLPKWFLTEDFDTLQISQR